MNDALTGTSEAAPQPLLGRWLKRLPGGQFAQEQIDKVERRLLAELKERMDHASPTTQVSVVAVSVTAPKRKGQDAPAALLRALLSASEESTRESGGTAFFVMVLKNMVPDEARLLAALSDGGHYPVIRLLAGSRLGPRTQCVLDHVSTIGKNAGVSWNDLTPVYLARLTHWGLIDLGAEDPALLMKYQILETEESIRRVQAQVKKAGQHSALQRHTIALSPLGQALWVACQVEGR